MATLTSKSLKVGSGINTSGSEGELENLLRKELDEELDDDILNFIHIVFKGICTVLFLWLKRPPLLDPNLLVLFGPL